MSGLLPLAAAAERLRGKPGRPKSSRPSAETASVISPRLLDLEASAIYLGRVSIWTVRDLIANGILPRVRVPLPNGAELRRVLLDREDLDRLILAWKDRA